MEHQRLFIGLPLPEEYQHRLLALTDTLRPLVPAVCTWTRPGNWHITLKFLGDTPASAIQPIQAALAAIDWSPFSFAAGDGGFFPSPIRPRVLWVGVAAGGRETCTLAAQIESALAGTGIAAEARPFTAHLTVARIKGAKPSGEWTMVMRALENTQWPEILMDRFVLWRSEAGGGEAGEKPGPPGPRYVPVGTYAAAGQPVRGG